ncbi:MAG: hypothetical protein ACR2M1_09150, partial [Gemmatimonadaceae bacterium]
MSNTLSRVALLSLVMSPAALQTHLQAHLQAPSPVRTSAAQATLAPSASTPPSLIGAPTPDSLAQLVLDRFASGTPQAFDSVYPDLLGRMVVQAAAQRKESRGAALHKVLWADNDRAVLLLTGTVHSGSGTGIGTGGDETNQVRRFSGLYEAARSGDSWTLTRQIPLDTANYIRAQTLHVALVPGKESHIVDTLALSIGSPYGFAARLNNAAQISEVRLDGHPAEYALGGGVLWIKAPERERSQLVLKYSIADEHEQPGSGT